MLERNDALEALQTRATALAASLTEAAGALASDGRSVPTVLLAALESFSEERRGLAVELGLDDLASLTELRMVVEARASCAGLRGRALQVVATVEGYEAALRSLQASVEAVTLSPVTAAALERALAAAEGTAPVTAVELPGLQHAFREAGLDEMVAIGLLAGHLVGPTASPNGAASLITTELESAAGPETQLSTALAGSEASAESDVCVTPAGDEPAVKPGTEHAAAPDVSAASETPPVGEGDKGDAAPDDGATEVDAAPVPDAEVHARTAAEELSAEDDAPLASDETMAEIYTAPPDGGHEPAEAPRAPEPTGASDASAAGRHQLASDAVAALLEAVKAGDLPLATWLARACEMLGATPPLPASGLAALVLADACGPGADDVAAQYEEEAVDALTSAHVDTSAALVHAAAALRASISLPYGNAPGVLRTMAPALPAPLRQLCDIVGEHAPRGELLQPGQAASSARDAARREEQLAAVRRVAGERYDRANDSYYPSFPAAARVWRRLVSQGEFGEILRATRDDERPSERTRALIDRFTDPREVDRLIDENFRAVRKSRDRIEASARQWLKRKAARALEPAREWIALSDEGASARVAAGGDGLPWLRNQLVELADAMRAKLGELTSADDRATAMAAELFDASREVLEDVVVRGRELPVPERGLNAAELLSAPLVRATDLIVDAEFLPAAATPEALAHALLDARRLTWEEALEARSSQHAHHLTRIALDHVDQDRRERLDEQRAEQLMRSRRALANHIDDVRKKLDAALRDQVLADAEHGQLVVRLRDVDPDREDLDAQRCLLDELADEIETAKRQRCRDLREEAAKLELRRADAERVVALLDAGELAVAAEHLARYRAGDTGPEAEIAPAVRPDAFAAYARAHDDKNLLELLKAADSPDRDLQALHVLTKLATSPTLRDAPAENVLRVLDAAGLEPRRPEQSERVANSMAVFNVPVRTAGGVCPVPDFGSRANGRYRVAVVAGRLAERDIVARIKGLTPRTGGPIVLLTGDVLSLARRQALAQQAIQEHVPFLVVDPLVLAFVAAGTGGSRAERFFAATLPFAWTNPYVTHGAVPPEMFFGRDSELHALLDASGSAFIYGGRQLGKSALLMKALTEVHAPSEGRCAVYLDLDAKRIGHGASTDLVWSHLGAELARELPDIEPGSDEASVSRFMLEWLEEDDHRQLLVLLDETDHFLEKEANGVDQGRARMHNVIAMRDLMRRADGRLKFVLAGLHSVQRFLHLPNQPLAHLGSPTPIGPLSWQHAARLVEEPMRALGYEFEPHVVDRVLTLTSRHPSLIQHVCRALVDHLSRRPRRKFPLTISLRDLDEVYEDRDLRREIRNRFDWTLDLDPRYRVLAYTLAYESLEQPAVHAGGLTAAELHQEARRWWPDGFDDLSRDEIVTLCDEMVQLRVFVEDGGRYRLWSPNIMQLLGSRSEIEERLVSDEGRERSAALDASRDRRRMNGAAGPRRSPLTYADEQRILEPGGPRVRLVLGTAATHAEEVLDALAVAGESPDWPQIVIEHHRRVPAVRDLDEDPATVHLAAVNGVGREWLRKRIRDFVRATNRPQRVVLVLGGHTVEWWDELLAEIALDSELAGAVRDVALKRWDQDTLRFLLDEARIPSTNDAERERVLAATGGWPLLLNRFLAIAQTHDRQLEPTLEAIEADQTWGRELIDALELERVPGLAEAARVLATTGEAMDATTLAAWCEHRFGLVQAQHLLDTLVLMQAASATSDGSGGAVALEARLANVLAAGADG